MTAGPSGRQTAGAAADRLVLRQVDTGRWSDLVRLFESRGGPRHCWCMLWRATAAEAKRRDGPSRKAALKRRVRAGIPIGILGYLDGEPVAWCSIAPRPSYRPLGGPGEASGDVWSIVCFFIVRRLRRQGVMERMLGAAIEHARRRGAKVIEGYPVEADSPSYRFMGFLPVFKAAGFSDVGMAGTRRHVVRLRLSPASGAAKAGR